MKKILHLSYTKIRMIRRCAQQFWFRYIDPAKPMPPDAWQTLGKSVHYGLHTNFKQKIETYQDLPLPDILDAYSTYFDYQKPVTMWDEEKPGEVKDGGVRLISLHYKEETPKIQPVLAEYQIEIPLPGTDLSFLEYIDVIDASKVIIDFKTTSRKPKDQVIHTDDQLTCYAWGFRELFGEEEQGVSFQYLIRRKKDQEILTMVGKRTKEDIEDFIREAQKIAGLIEAGLKIGGLPKNPDSFYCTPKKCGYYRMCHPHRKIEIF